MFYYVLLYFLPLAFIYNKMLNLNLVDVVEVTVEVAAATAADAATDESEVVVVAAVAATLYIIFGV